MKSISRSARIAFALVVLAALGLWAARGVAAGRRGENARAMVFENRSPIAVESVTVDLLRDEMVLGSTTVQYADNTPVGQGEKLWLDLADLEAGDRHCRFRLCANTADGPVYSAVLSLRRWDEGLRAALVQQDSGLGFCLWSE